MSMQFTTTTPTLKDLLSLGERKAEGLSWDPVKEKKRDGSLRKAALHRNLLEKVDVAIQLEAIEAEKLDQKKSTNGVVEQPKAVDMSTSDVKSEQPETVEGEDKKDQKPSTPPVEAAAGPLAPKATVAVQVDSPTRKRPSSSDDIRTLEVKKVKVELPFSQDPEIEKRYGHIRRKLDAMFD